MGVVNFLLVFGYGRGKVTMIWHDNNCPLEIPTGRLKPTLLADIIGVMVRENLAVYEPPKQTRAVVLYWRLPEEWAEVLHEWVRAPPSSDPIITLFE